MSKMPADVKKALKIFLEDPAKYFMQAYDEYELIFELVESDKEERAVRAYFMPDHPTQDWFRVVEIVQSTGLPYKYQPGQQYDYDCNSITATKNMEEAIVKRGYKLRYEKLSWTGPQLNHEKIMRGLQNRNQPTDFYAKAYNQRTAINIPS